MQSTVSQPNQGDVPRLTPWQLTSYGLLTMPIAMAGLALLTYLPTFYAIDMGLGLGVVGAIFLGGRFLDILTDPMIGHLSDQTRSRFGPRKPWMAAGIVGFCAALWFLLVPPGDIGPAYLIIAGTVFFISMTMLDVPYSSTGLEISPYVDERSRLASAKAGFQVAGALLAGTMPLLLTTSASGSLPAIAISAIGLAALGFLLFIAFVPARNRVEARSSAGITASLKTILAERRYKYLLGPFFIIQTANALFSGLAVLYITFIVKAPGLVGLFIGLLFLSTALFLPLWLAVARRVGKAKCWQAGIMISMVALLAMPLFGEGDVVAICILFAVIGGTFGCDAVMPTSMLADIASDHESETGDRLSGVYLSVKNAVSKCAFAAPMGLAFPVLGYLEFETSETHDPVTLLAFMGFFALIPVALKCVAILIMRRGPDFHTAQAS
ncbi:MFS transporter [Pontixanthobacter aestiaquae]|uniref:MFS transporter n=1 Tax=Pontixanthobacter aestiaquae TaxID=1509367 RepID=A0A844Z1P4_9SPHN|nr:MFS transporter [Pontixanthobacter aestiaquae]MDN3646370.1 MFS transporter [Pontixanthobacter aestiaquae]MXO82641.1 MFS transporter [Pontixanthobacter aestiaquae]